MIIIQIIIKDNKTFIDSIFYNDSIELNVLLSHNMTLVATYWTKESLYESLHALYQNPF